MTCKHIGVANQEKFSTKKKKEKRNKENPTSTAEIWKLLLQEFLLLNWVKYLGNSSVLYIRIRSFKHEFSSRKLQGKKKVHIGFISS